MSERISHTPIRQPAEPLTTFEVQTFLQRATQYHQRAAGQQPTPVRTLILQYYPVGTAFRLFLSFVFPAQAGWVVDATGTRALTAAEVVAWSRRNWAVLSGPPDVMEAQAQLRREWRDEETRQGSIHTPNETVVTRFAPVIGTNHLYVDTRAAPLGADGRTIYIDVEGEQHIIALHWRT